MPMPEPDEPTDATRLFYAVLPDADARERLSTLALEAAGRTGGRAARPDTLHLTLVFVGTLPASRVGEAIGAAGAIAWQRCQLDIDRLGAFVRAGVAWAGPTGIVESLAAGQRALIAALAQCGIDTDPRPWRPHVTLARGCVRPLAGRIDPPITWEVDRVVLMGSRLARDGPRYREIASWPTELPGSPAGDSASALRT
ncbi:MAG: RNA 2',3'-cyclic phosphodiesterase [Burkholderiales bacterium]|nr:RNA 2',3'-cyclic phosphodiesterase [Burkholderiales bacterium]MCC7114896.1 RNA 2',3'-cyclic phosphodiesterase [Burkholderiales bacterium]